MNYENEQTLRFFATGEMTLYIEHEAALAGDELRRALVEHPVLQRVEVRPFQVALKEAQISTLALPQKYRVQERPRPSRALRPREGERHLSLATLKLRDDERPLDDERLTDLVLKLDHAIVEYEEGYDAHPQELPIRGRVSPRATDYLREKLQLEQLKERPKRLRHVQAPVDLWRLLQGKTLNIQNQPQEPLELHGASFNWLVVSGGELIGIGGPGSIPTPTPYSEPEPSTERFAINTERAGDDIGDCDGNGSHVYILDTAHSWDGFNGIYERYVKGQQHHLLEKLVQRPASGTLNGFNFGAGFEVWPSTKLDDLSDDQRSFYPDPEYNAADHGLFIAGIVRTVAPRAPITLVEVLNSHGVGTMDAIIDGFARVAQALPRERRRVVINCSFMLATPEEEFAKHKPELSGDSNFRRSSRLVAQNPRQVELPKTLFNALTLLFRNQEVSLVAAAGNEGANGTHPPARHPAASAAAVGVGAIQSDGSDTPYSNLADTPLADGFQVIGGMADSDNFANNDSSAGELGILGIFTQDFPDSDNVGSMLPNENGWGYWAGTSFATPIVAGLLARLRGCGKSHEESIKLLRDLPPNETPSDAGILQVSQG